MALRFFGLGETELRALLRPNAALAERLSESATAAFPPRPPLERGRMIGKLGPLMKHPVAPPLDIPDRSGPDATDIETLLGNHDFAPNRLAQYWQILLHWMGEAATAQYTMRLDWVEALALDTRLRSAGVDGGCTLEASFAAPLALELPLPSGGRLAVIQQTQLIETAREIDYVLPELDQPTVKQLIGWRRFLQQATDEDLPEAIAWYGAN